MLLSNITVIFPLAVALFIFFWFARWVGIHRRAFPIVRAAANAGAGQVLPMPEDSGTAGEDSAADTGSARRARPGLRFTKLDWILLAAVTVVYGIVAFIGLGDTEAPQSFLHFAAGNVYAQIELTEPQEISGIRYYSGLNTFDYTLQFSVDGETWTDQTCNGEPSMTQQYTQVFRWNEASLDNSYGTVRYIRIISGGEEWLGEVALYGSDGHLLTEDEYTAASGCEALFDEQDIIPEQYSYMNGTYFDEIYFPRTALEMIQNIWPYEITHPPLGKAIISLGIRIFGMTPFGWRFMGVTFGILMLPVLYVFLKKMFGWTAAACGGTVLFAFDFMHYTQTRLATIDTYAVFFTLLMYLFMYFWLTEPREHTKKRLLWLGLSGLFFGLGAASKWTCFYAGAGLGILWLVYWIVRIVREKKAVILPLAENILWCLLFFIVIPALIYYASYWSYAPSQGITGPWRLFSRDYLQLVLDNQHYMLNYHATLVSEHPYSSRWYQWLLDIRPILYYLEYFDDGTKSAFGAFSNPVVCWTGLLAMGGMVWLAVRERDHRAIFILIGYLANLLPWVLISRLTFAYHYFPCTVFLILAISLLLADLREHDTHWDVSVTSLGALGVCLFTLFYPVLSGLRIGTDYTTALCRWFADTWPF